MKSLSHIIEGVFDKVDAGDSFREIVSGWINHKKLTWDIDGDTFIVKSPDQPLYPSSFDQAIFKRFNKLQLNGKYPTNIFGGDFVGGDTMFSEIEGDFIKLSCISMTDINIKARVVHFQTDSWQQDMIDFKNVNCIAPDELVFAIKDFTVKHNLKGRTKTLFLICDPLRVDKWYDRLEEYAHSSFDNPSKAWKEIANNLTVTDQIKMQCGNSMLIISKKSFEKSTKSGQYYFQYTKNDAIVKL